MTGPPDLWGRTPQPMDISDWRWLAVKDAPAPDNLLGPYAPPLSLAVDRMVNATIDYRRDVRDHWSTPRETWAAAAGDCEDCALLKRAILLERGMDESRIFFLLVRDVQVRENHAVLLVEDDGWHVLDCRRCLKQCLPIEEVQDFTALEAMQGNERWKYGEGN